MKYRKDWLGSWKAGKKSWKSFLANVTDDLQGMILKE